MHEDGRLTVIHYHHGSDTLTRKTLKSVLEAYNWAVDNTVGSHSTFLKGKKRLVLVRPHGGRYALHPKDVKKVLEAIEAI